jgi:hypothetical protein
VPVSTEVYSAPMNHTGDLTMFDLDNVEPYPRPRGELLYDPRRHTPRCAHHGCRRMADAGKPFCPTHLTGFDARGLDDTSAGYL